MPSIYDINLASATLLEQYESQGYNDLLQALFLANDTIERNILKTQGVWTQRKLNEIKRLIDAEIGNAYGGLFASMQEESLAIAEINMNAVLGYSSLATSLPKGAVDDLIKTTRPIQMSFNEKTKQATEYTFKDLFKLTEENHARQLKVTLAGGVAQGLTPAQIIKQYGIKSNALSKGQVKSNVFSVVTDSKNEGNYQGYKELESRGLIKYYEHVSVLDGGTSPICRSLDGRKYYMSIDEIPQGFKPILHGNCRSQLVPRTEDSDQLRASQDGVIPQERYPVWFDKQSATFQRSVLGNKKYDLYKKGIYKINSLPDVVGNRKKDLKQYQASLFDVVKG